jgi:thiol-disulfide isomerase/thioredoxin
MSTSLRVTRGNSESNRKKTADNDAKDKYVITTIDDVIRLNSGSDGFDHKKPYVVLIHAPWCFYCRNLRPEWDKVTAALKSDKTKPHEGIQVVEFDFSVMNDARAQGSRLISSLERNDSRVMTVPHLAMVTDEGRKLHKYDSSSIDPKDYELPENARPRSAHHMMDFLKHRMQCVGKRPGKNGSSEKKQPPLTTAKTAKDGERKKHTANAKREKNNGSPPANTKTKDVKKKTYPIKNKRRRTPAPKSRHLIK